jgi:chromosomal replication initiator protein
LQPLTPSSRREIARALVEKNRLHVTDDVIEWLARRPTGGARPILGDIIRLKHLSRVHPSPLDLALVMAELPELAAEGIPVLERIADAVAAFFNIKPSQLKGRGRQRHLLWPRHVGMYLARQLRSESLARIGVFFGGYDHSTVLHACRQVDQKLKDDMRSANELNQLRASLI